MSEDSDDQGAGVRVPPPLVFLTMLLIAILLELKWPLESRLSSGFNYLGFALVILSTVTIIYISKVFSRHRTNIEPWKPTTTLVITGFYAYSRNPIYVTFCLLVVGLGMVFNHIWMMFSFFPSALFVYITAIKKEEIYLERRFGKKYLVYKDKVRRWL